MVYIPLKWICRDEDYLKFQRKRKEALERCESPPELPNGFYYGSDNKIKFEMYEKLKKLREP
jgi:hypothetical protein